MTQRYEGFQTFIDSGTRTYTLTTEEPEAQYLTSAMLSEYVQAISSATSSPAPSYSRYFEIPGGYQYQGNEWQPFPEPHEYWQTANEIRENEEPPFPTGRRLWEEVERPIARDSTLRDMYPPVRETEGPGIESISMIGFR